MGGIIGGGPSGGSTVVQQRPAKVQPRAANVQKLASTEVAETSKSIGRTRRARRTQPTLASLDSQVVSSILNL